MTVNKTVFISYSWSSEHHESWVMDLAKRLTSSGVQVKIDKWDLKEGQDKYNFMETAVKSKEINKVLIILDKTYVEKADGRTGGVGTETQIISPEVYANVSQEKFIPIIAQRDEKGEEFMPTYLKGRIYVDLSLAENYENNFELLLRNIFERPIHNRPKLGIPPQYLFEENPSSFQTNSILKSFDNNIDKYPNRTNSILKNFLDAFFDDLKSITVSNTGYDDLKFSKEVYNKLSIYTPLRNDFVDFFDKLLKSGVEFDVDIVIKFIEKLPSLQLPQDERSSWLPAEFYHFSIITHELFIYLIATGLKNERYKVLQELLHSKYFFIDKYNRNLEPQPYNYIYSKDRGDIIRSYYRELTGTDYINPMADLIVKNVHEKIGKDLFTEADLLCHYVDVYQNKHWPWFPITYIYRQRNRHETLYRFISTRHFEKAKVLFNVATKEEFILGLHPLEAKNEDRSGYGGRHYDIIPIYKVVSSNQVATER